MSEFVTNPILPAIRPPRPVQDNIPPTKRRREALLSTVRSYIAAQHAVPPLSLEELDEHCDQLIPAAGLDRRYRPYVVVLLNNELWLETLAGVPYDRRLLLLPQCLRHEGLCKGDVDDFGLICRQCGSCLIGDLKTEAERLGYVVLVAEGSPVVMSLIQTGRIDAMIGVSCLEMLERVFPYVEAAAIPAIAIPLLQDGCANTSVDADWVWEAIYLTSSDKTRRLDIESLRREVNSWFTREHLSELLGAPAGSTTNIAHDWLARAGKRWRPLLAVCAFTALSDRPQAAPSGGVKKLALAVECFHKASLIHDDIEDHDRVRYGQKTLHEEHGVEIALNVGDFLLGEGYRMIAECDAPPRQIAKMLSAAAGGHRDLCIGQGEELAWLRERGSLSVQQVLDIFRLKTAPAFNVSLGLGSLAAGAGDGMQQAFNAYSESLGIAYQIRDDLNDWAAQVSQGRTDGPSILLAIANQHAAKATAPDLEKPLADGQVFDRGRQLLECYKQRAIRSLRSLENANLKGLLRRLVGKIFADIEPMGCCNDYKAGDARRGRAGRKSTR